MAINQIYVVDNLINSMKLRGLPPTSQNTFTLAQFAQVLSEEMQSNIVPLMDSVSEEFFVTNYDQDFDGGTLTYAIPPRAVGAKLRDVVFVDDNGKEIPIPRLRPEMMKENNGAYFGINPWGMYLKDDSVCFFFGNGSAPTYPTLRMKYLRRPSILLLSTSCGQIQAIDRNTNIVTLSYASDDWDTVDIIKGVPNFVSRGDDITVTNVSGFDVTLSEIPDSVEVGDWVAPSNYSPIPQIPVEGHLLLAQYGAAKILEAMNDATGLTLALQKINGDPNKPGSGMREQFLQIITPRVEGAVIKISGAGGIGDAMDNGW